MNLHEIENEDFASRVQRGLRLSLGSGWSQCETRITTNPDYPIEYRIIPTSTRWEQLNTYDAQWYSEYKR